MQLLINIGKKGNFAGHPTLSGVTFDDWSCVLMTTNGVKVSFYYKKWFTNNA